MKPYASLRTFCFFTVLLLLLEVSMTHFAFAEKVCLKGRGKKKRVKLTVEEVDGDSCPKGFTELFNTDTFSKSIYGDGSASTRNVNADETLADQNLQYTDVTVAAGATLTIPSGSVIRCTGLFTNNGTIVVQSSGAHVAGGGSVDAATIDGAYNYAEPGVSVRAAMHGEIGDNTALRSGGVGGLGRSEFQARQLRHLGIHGGGSGAWGGTFGTGLGATDIGSAGGGTLTILCKEGIVNAAGASISANGDGDSASGNGGGAGGVIILASKISVTNSGTVNANGGVGEDSDADEGPSGGGGGGIVHMIAPAVTLGTVNVAGGAAGVTGAAGSVTDTPRGGGGGGGASGGNGGVGGNVDGADTPGDAAAGETGQALMTTVDPAALF